MQPGPHYGRPDSPDGDFGAANGYAGANDYGYDSYDPAGGNPENGYYDGDYDAAGYDSGNYETGGYDREVYESGGFTANGYDSGGYQKADQPGDGAQYRARRHRPSANDTNVGSLADFASYGGYQDDHR